MDEDWCPRAMRMLPLHSRPRATSGGYRTGHPPTHVLPIFVSFLRSLRLRMTLVSSEHMYIRVFEDT